MILDQFAPVAEFNGYHALRKAGIDMNKIASIEAYNLSNVHTVEVKTYTNERISYIVSREYELIAEKYHYNKARKQENRPKSAKYKRAEALFAELTGNRL